MKKFLFLLPLIFASCTFVKPSDRLIIAANAQNANATNTKVQLNNYIEIAPDGTQKPANYIKVWWAAENTTWQAMKAWSEGKALNGN